MTTIVTEVGWKAAAALGRSGRTARVVARVADSAWLDVAGELVWLGRCPSPDHPRTVQPAPVLRHPRALFTPSRIAAGEMLELDLGRARAWRPCPLPSAFAGRRVVEGAAGLRASLHRVGRPRGLGALLLAGASGIPRDVPARAIPAVERLAAACRADDAAAALEAARPLLGLGHGLTPAGDDLVGGVFFARALLARARLIDPDAWHRAAAALVVAARAATHPVSAALLEDLVALDSHEVLRALARSLIDERPAAAVDAARDVVRLGNSSGWEILAGFLLGCVIG